MPRKRKSPAGFSPFGHASRADKRGGPDDRQKEGKQIESSSSKQHLVSAVQDKMKSIAEQLGPADARFVKGIFCCMGNEGDDVVRHLMGELAAEGERADEAEARAAELEGQIQEFQFQSAQRFRR
jgi:hypothetical protein